MSNLSISKIGPESEGVLRNLFQHYLHDMAEWFEIDTEPDGSYAYDLSSIWKNYDVYLAKVDDALAGVALIGSAAEWLGDTAAHDIHEFFVIRRFRKSGFGKRMATILWSKYPGEWLVRVLEANAPAVLFWRSVIAGYVCDAYYEEGRTVGGRPWRFFQFRSLDASAAKPDR